ERIVVNHPEAEVFYNFPIINDKGRTSKSEVLPMLQFGSPARTRTSDKLVTGIPLSFLKAWTISSPYLLYRFRSRALRIAYANLLPCGIVSAPSLECQGLGSGFPYDY
ncbi:MAG: hypothetical protein KKD05_05265, partial [Candidatus Omnitrophica bacterium]|nr:hypothetical protein [Candidatus Omnitrophota bacterium]